MLTIAIHGLFNFFVSCEEPCSVFLSYLNYIEFQVLLTLLTPHNTESNIPVSLCKISSRGLTAELLRCKYSDDNFPNKNYEEFGCYVAY